MELLRDNLSSVRIPEPTNLIHKNQCCVSFDTPKSEGGLFVDMTSFQAFGKDYVELNYEDTGNPVYLHIKETSKMPSLPAIGMEGPEYEKSYEIVILPKYVTLTFPSAELPEKVRLAVEAVIMNSGVVKRESIAACTDDMNVISKHAIHFHLNPMDLLRANLSRVRIPEPTNLIYKKECFVSFDTPRSEGGLFVDMNSFLAFGKDYVGWNYEETGDPVYLHIKERPSKKPTLLAIGMEGPEYEESYEIVILPKYVTLTFPSAELPEKVRLAVDAVIMDTGAEKKEKIAAWKADTKLVRKHAMDLSQLDDGVIVPPSGCDKTDNLRLNLPDGSILCGRRNWDGIGGNDSTVNRYSTTKYPLAVKLGTITADLEAAVASDDDGGINANEDIVLQPVSMGFPNLHCQKPAINTSNAGVGEATSWLLNHVNDSDIDAPIKKGKDTPFIDSPKATTIFVKMLDGRTLSFEAKISDSVQQIKEKIQDRSGIRQEVQRLCLGGKPLEDCYLIGNYTNNIKERTFFLNLSLQGGVQRKKEVKRQRDDQLRAERTLSNFYSLVHTSRDGVKADIKRYFDLVTKAEATESAEFDIDMVTQEEAEAAESDIDMVTQAEAEADINISDSHKKVIKALKTLKKVNLSGENYKDVIEHINEVRMVLEYEEIELIADSKDPRFNKISNRVQGSLSGSHIKFNIVSI